MGKRSKKKLRNKRLGVSSRADFSRDVVAEKIDGDAKVSIAHGGWGPLEAIWSGGPNAAEGTPIGEDGKGPFVDPEWLRGVDDLNKEFTEHVRDYGRVVVGSEVGGTLCERFFRQSKKR